MSGTIIMMHGTQHRDLGYHLAKYLHKKHGIKVILIYESRHHIPKDGITEYTDKSGTKYSNEFYSNEFSEVYSLEEILNNTTKKTFDVISADVDKIERSGVINILDAIRADRHVGKGFFSSVDFPSSVFGRKKYDDILNISIDFIEFYKNLFSIEQPMCIISGYGTLASRLLCSVAKDCNIPVRTTMMTRSGTRATWACSESLTPFNFNYSYKVELNRSKDLGTEEFPKEITSSPVEGKNILDLKIKNNTITGLLGGLFNLMKRDLYSKFSGRKNYFGGYDTIDSLVHIARTWYITKKYIYKHPKEKNISINRPYIYYPLHLEPESTLMSESQESDNQLTIIDWLAKNIPANWNLIIKEHPGFSSPRSSGFWKKIHSYPNVVVLNPYIDADRIVVKSSIVATINGTTGFQAALLGIPVISFQKEYLPIVMDHVFYSNSYHSVKSTIFNIRYNREHCVRNIKTQCPAFKRALECNSVELDSTGKKIGNYFGYKLGIKFISCYANLLLKSLENHNQRNN